MRKWEVRRIKLRRYVDVLEKAIDSNSEGQLREAISVARKAVPTDSDDAEITRLNLTLGWGFMGFHWGCGLVDLNLLESSVSSRQ